MKYDDHEREQLRRGLALLVEETPVAPDLTTVFTARAQVSRRGWTPLTVFVTVALGVVVGVGGIALLRAGGSPAPIGTEATTVPVPATTVIVEPTTVPVPTTTPAPDPGSMPYVLPTLEGWSITSVAHDGGVMADGSGEYSGAEIGLSDGTNQADLYVESGALADLDARILDRESEYVRVEDAEVLDTSAAMMVDAEGIHRAIWAWSDVVFELSGRLDEAPFRSMLGSLTLVDEETWLAAMPDSVVTDRSAAVTEYLADVPLPAGFDTVALTEGPAEDRYHVGADVAGAVACAWIDRWIAGKTAGDQMVIDEAIAALATSREWDILVDMSAQGGFPEGVWEYADALAGDGTVVMGRVLTVEESYMQALGCD